MPRQKLSEAKRPPTWLGRFGYWGLAIIKPDAYPPTAKGIGDSGHRLCATAFQAHLKGEPCGGIGCKLDQLLLRGTDPEKRAFLALERYAQEDRWWNQDPAAQKVYKGLATAQRKKIDKLETNSKRCGFRSSWDELFRTIAGDQIVFQKTIGFKDKQSGHFKAMVVGDRRVTAAEVENIYKQYSKQRQHLLGNITGKLGHLALKEKIITSTDNPRPPIPRKKARTSVQETGRGAEDAPERTQPEQETHPPKTARSGPIFTKGEKKGDALAKEKRDAMVFHWFAHALRNIKQYKGRRPPLPWSPWDEDCSRNCLKKRNKLAKITHPSASRR